MLSALTEENSKQVEAILADLLVQGEARAVFLCDRGGNIIANKYVTAYDHQENIAALASGSFFATLEMAKLVGETEFESLLHQGKQTSIYMISTSGELLMLVVFGKDSNPGLIKLHAKNACMKLDSFNLDVGDINSATGKAISDLKLEMDKKKSVFKLKK